MEQALETEYKEVPQDWINGYDLENAKNGENKIVFYDNKNEIVSNLAGHKSYHENITYNIQQDYLTQIYLRKPLYVKTDDYAALTKYIENINSRRRNAEETQKKEKEIEKNKKIENKKKEIQLMKEKLISVVDDDSKIKLSETDKTNLKQCIEYVENIITKYYETENNISLTNSNILKDFSDNINEKLKNTEYSKYYIQNDIIIIQNGIIIPKEFNDTNKFYEIKTTVKDNYKYTFEMNVPNIIFFYDFDNQTFTLTTMEIKKIYTCTNHNNNLIINTIPPILGSEIQKKRDRSAFIYKAYSAPEIVPESVPEIMTPKIVTQSEVPSGTSKIRQTLNYLNPFKCFNGNCTNKVAPNGGKRTRKNKKTRKHKNKKVFRKIKSFRKIRKR